MELKDLKKGDIIYHHAITKCIVIFDHLDGDTICGIQHVSITNNKYEKGGYRKSYLTELRLATPEEKHWLQECIKAKKFISKEEALKTFKNYEYQVVHCKTQGEWNFVIDTLKSKVPKTIFSSKNGAGYMADCLSFDKLESHCNCYLQFYQESHSLILSFEEWCTKFGHTFYKIPKYVEATGTNQRVKKGKIYEVDLTRSTAWEKDGVRILCDELGEGLFLHDSFSIVIPSTKEAYDAQFKTTSDPISEAKTKYPVGTEVMLLKVYDGQSCKQIIEQKHFDDYHCYPHYNNAISAMGLAGYLYDGKSQWAEIVKQETKTEEKMFKKDEYIVTLKVAYSSANCGRNNYCFKQRLDARSIYPYVDLQGSASNGHDVMSYDKKGWLTDWRYATKEEIAEYDRLEKPYDVTELRLATWSGEEFSCLSEVKFIDPPISKSVPKAEFIRGKWYKHLCDSKDYYGKYDRYDDSNYIWVTEWISKTGVHHDSSGRAEFHSIELADLVEISKYLPKGHRDRIEDPEQYLLEEAKRRYPVGTTYTNLSWGELNFTVVTQSFNVKNPNLVFAEDGKGVLYKNGQWAPIVSESIARVHEVAKTERKRKLPPQEAPIYEVKKVKVIKRTQD